MNVFLPVIWSVLIALVLAVAVGLTIHYVDLLITWWKKKRGE